jgi:hypothetical protein
MQIISFPFILRKSVYFWSMGSAIAEFFNATYPLPKRQRTVIPPFRWFAPSFVVIDRLG